MDLKTGFPQSTEASLTALRHATTLTGKLSTAPRLRSQCVASATQTGSKVLYGSAEASEQSVSTSYSGAGFETGPCVMHSPCRSICVKVKAHREAGELLTLVFSALVSEFSLFNEHSAFSAANDHFPLRNHQLDVSLRRPLVSGENNYGARSQLSDRQNPEEHR